MTTKELAKNLGLESVFQNDDDREVKDCYIGDLLSWVMGKAKPESVWVTIMSNVNVAAVASLTDVSAVIFAESVEPDDDLRNKITKSDTIFYKSPLSAYELAWRIKEILDAAKV